MPRKFDKFNEENVSKKDFEKRTYFGRTFLQFGGNTMGADADDLDVVDYEFNASSFPDALGQWIAKQVQVAVGNQVVKYTEFICETLDEIIDGKGEGYEAIIDYIGKHNKDAFDETIKEVHEGVLPEMPIPAGFVRLVAHRILEIMNDHNNYMFWQEPQLLMFGNPDIIENMHIAAANTIADEAKEGIDNIDAFLKTKFEEE